MKIRKISEIIDTSGELIGYDSIPEYGANLETQANNTTDYNMNVGSQKFKYNSMSMMGFNMIPFYEVKEGEDLKTELLDNLAKYFYEYYIDILKYYYKNPNKLKSDYRIKSEEEFNDTENIEQYYKISDDVISIIEPFIKKSPEQIDEDFMIKEKNNAEFIKKSEDNDLSSKKINNIADLLNKLDKKDLKKIINLLEING
jgi:hypothetical protein